MTLFNNYTFKQKNFALLVIFALLLAAVYKRAIKPTLEGLEVQKELIVQKNEAINSLETLRVKQQAISNMNKVLGKQNLSTEKVQQGLLNFYDSLDLQRLVISQIDEPFIYNHPDFNIYSNQVTLKGDFKGMLNFVYQLENNFNMARLLSLEFERNKNYITSKNELYMKLILQNFEKK